MPAKKDKEARLVTKGNLYYVEWVGGGQLPKALKGGYTSSMEALAAIERYDNAKPDCTKPKAKRKVNGPSTDRA